MSILLIPLSCSTCEHRTGALLGADRFLDLFDGNGHEHATEASDRIGDGAPISVRRFTVDGDHARFPPSSLQPIVLIRFPVTPIQRRCSSLSGAVKHDVWTRRRTKSGVEAGVYTENCAGNQTSSWTSQERDRAGDFTGLAKPAKRCEAPLIISILAIGGVHFRVS